VINGDGPIELRQDVPHTARMYDYYLGGKDNYEADRAAAEKVLQVWPGVRLAARKNREFMHRAVTYLAGEQGVTQFLDIGTGIPTRPNLHQVAQGVDPHARVVYVDHDPIVLAHARALLVGTPEGRTEYIDADVTEPRAILTAPKLHATLDLSRPVALSLLALLHFVPDSLDAYGIVATLLEPLASGSYLLLSHVTPDFDPAGVARAEEIYRQSGVEAQARTYAEFGKFFEGLELVEPGIVPPHRWRWHGVPASEDMDVAVTAYVAVARKP
jgi:SAM-dependent methyltransferase